MGVGLGKVKMKSSGIVILKMYIVLEFKEEIKTVYLNFRVIGM